MSDRLTQAPDVLLDRGSGDPTREGRAPVCVLGVIFVEFIGADSQFNLARTLGQAGMTREKIKDKALR